MNSMLNKLYGLRAPITSAQFYEKHCLIIVVQFHVNESYQGRLLSTCTASNFLSRLARVINSIIFITTQLT